jgi:hypothetical protein
MSRRFWLTLLLIIHFLPWPGSQMLFSSIFTEPSGLSSAFGESDHTLIERFENGVIFSHSLPDSSEEFLVICEADSESSRSGGFANTALATHKHKLRPPNACREQLPVPEADP